MKRRAGIAVVALLAGALAGASCGKKPPNSAEKVKFRHGDLPAGWKESPVDGLTAAWYHEALGATIGLGAQCKELEDVGLHALAQQALVGVERREILEQTTIPIDGREAEDWVVKGSMDGVEVRINLVVHRDQDCVYDLNLVSRPDTFEKARADFRAFVGGFAIDGTRKAARK